MIRTLLICGAARRPLRRPARDRLRRARRRARRQPGHRLRGAAQRRRPRASRDEPELVTRGVQRTVGLLTAAVVYGVALGGLFALAFAFAYGRVGRAEPGAHRAVARGRRFVGRLPRAVPEVPGQPAGGRRPGHDRQRTALYLAMIVVSIFWPPSPRVRIRRRGWPRADERDRDVVAARLVPRAGRARRADPAGRPRGARDFPATTLWRFREASLGMQAVLWTTIGVVFAVAAQRVMVGAPERGGGAAGGLVASPGD